jgi:hypothetical protein
VRATVDVAERQEAIDMKYAILIYDENTANPSSEAPPDDVIQAVMDEYFGYSKMLRDRGAFQAGEALQPNPTATTIRASQSGGVTTTDGPFAETKEGLGGFYIVEAADLDEALELGKACPGLKYGAAIEVRPVVEFEADYADRAVERAGATAG